MARSDFPEFRSCVGVMVEPFAGVKYTGAGGSACAGAADTSDAGIDEPSRFSKIIMNPIFFNNRRMNGNKTNISILLQYFWSSGAAPQNCRAPSLLSRENK